MLLCSGRLSTACWRATPTCCWRTMPLTSIARSTLTSSTSNQTNGHVRRSSTQPLWVNFPVTARSQNTPGKSGVSRRKKSAATADATLPETRPTLNTPGLWDTTGPAGIPVQNFSNAPLAERMRPRTVADFAGQEHLLGPGRILERMIESDTLSSLIFWGPPGCGKTTLAHVIARETTSHFIFFSAILSGIKEIREIFREAENYAARGVHTILFVDEI